MIKIMNVSSKMGEVWEALGERWSEVVSEGMLGSVSAGDRN